MNRLSVIQKLISLFRPKTNTESSIKNPIKETELIGRWTVFMPKALKEGSLEISSEGKGYYNTHPLKDILPQKSPDQLILKDRFGYQLIMEKIENEQYVLFDELEDITYPIVKEH